MTGHTTVEELKAAQGTVPTEDPRDLLGDFWPEEEDIDVFLPTLHEWLTQGDSPEFSRT